MLDFLKNLPELWAFLISMVPVIELRGALPVALASGVSLPVALIITIAGNLLPIPFILIFIRPIFKWFKKLGSLRKFVQSLEERAFKKSDNIFLNSVGLDFEKIELMTNLALENNSNLIALTMSKESGIPKTSDGRLEIAFQIYEKCLGMGLNSEKIFFDPLVLPIKVDQSQALESLNTLKMIKESFDPPVSTVVGLSNISNGMPSHLRPLVNKVYGVMAFGAGLDAVIMDATDTELIRVFRMLENQAPEKEIDSLYLRISEMIANFGELEDIEYDASDIEQEQVIKTCEVILNKKIYSDSFAIV